MRVYIAGPMTGYAEHNWPAFLDAQKRWIDKGHDTVTPITADDMVWQRHFGRNFNPSTDKLDYGDPLMKEVIGEDLKLLASADAIALLPGWKQSRGTLHELATANFLRMKVYDAITYERLDSAGRPMAEVAA